MTSPRPDWHARALCHGAHELFHPDGRSDELRRKEEKAKAICATCPVRKECLDYALTVREADGIWGGYTTQEREHLLKIRRRRARQAMERTGREHDHG